MNEIELAAFVDRAEHFARCRHFCAPDQCDAPLGPLPPAGIRLSYGPFYPGQLTDQEIALAETELTRRLGAPALIWISNTPGYLVSLLPGDFSGPPAVADYGGGFELLTRKDNP